MPKAVFVPVLCNSLIKPTLNRLDVSGIAKNGYIIKIYINNMVYTKKIIIY
ncbi:MAG: hypothetical protein HY738_21885 [Bacteroidia bacterium]|nr:hypothetical protein [Bacteroidia bacterium]